MAQDGIVSAVQFSALVAAGGILRDLALVYPARYGAVSKEFDENALRKSRNDFLDNIE